MIQIYRDIRRQPRSLPVFASTSPHGDTARRPGGGARGGGRTPLPAHRTRARTPRRNARSRAPGTRTSAEADALHTNVHIPRDGPRIMRDSRYAMTWLRSAPVALIAATTARWRLHHPRAPHRADHTSHHICRASTVTGRHPNVQTQRGATANHTAPGVHVTREGTGFLRGALSQSSRHQSSQRPDTPLSCWWRPSHRGHATPVRLSM